MNTKQRYEFQPEFAVAPCETLRETIESLGMTQKELATRTGLTVQSLNRIFKDKQPITYETANKLELATGVPARFWNSLEAQYREQLAKLEEREQLKQDWEWLKEIPVSELRKRGYIQPTRDKSLLLREILGFYGVSSVGAYRDIWESPKVAARRSPCFESNPGWASAWIRMGELQAQQIETQPFDRGKFTLALQKIRHLTYLKADVFEAELKRLCAEAGVAVALVPKLNKVPWHGATKWLKYKAMILLSLRGRGEDKFWVSFFHEAGHILLHGKSNLYINDESKEDQQEIQADRYAANILIPERYNSQIRQARSKESIRRLADEIGVCPGIVAGRYQFLTQKWNRFHDLIRKLDWKTA
ncbi:MAG: helix-turn-helix domain-containing protein [Phycisphaerae bacterium]|nr:helix-turn-helix domain-containing protein [Phycisphaerae bacterium]